MVRMFFGKKVENPRMHDEPVKRGTSKGCAFVSRSPLLILFQGFPLVTVIIVVAQICEAIKESTDR